MRINVKNIPTETISIDLTPLKGPKMNFDKIVKLKPLGTGNYGIVYLAYDDDKEMNVALKEQVILKPDIEQLTKECKILTKCNHPNIVPCLGLQVRHQKIYIEMEYMDIGSLERIVQFKQPLDEKIVQYIGFEILKGLHYLHKVKHIAHRDIKPANILVNSKGDIKISDFGISAEMEKTDAQMKTWIGTKFYMSPERMDSEIYDVRSDIWSLGLVLWTLSIGIFPYFQNDPFSGNIDFLKARKMIVDGPLPDFSQHFSNEYKDFLSRCLRKNHKDRKYAKDLLKHPFMKSAMKTNKSSSQMNSIRMWFKEFYKKSEEE